MQKIKVFIVDDSAVVRQMMVEILKHDSGIEVIGVASDPLFAMDKMSKAWPDVLILDVEMPRMDGITFLRKLMSTKPIPVIICSSLTEKGAETTLQALSLGAFEVIFKPKVSVKNFLTDTAQSLIATVKAAANVRADRLKPKPVVSLDVSKKLSADAVLPTPTPQAMLQTTESLVAIGTSTGGTQALEQILTRLPRVCPGIVIVQHMPEKFTASFAMRLNQLCEIEVREAQNGDRVLPGLALIAPGGRHMALKRSGATYHVEILDGPLVNLHKPCVDVLFRSVARYAGKNAKGIIMTGMGDDGAKGLREMYDVGSQTFAQDENSCVVFGMPKEAIKLGGVGKVCSLLEFPRIICG